MSFSDNIQRHLSATERSQVDALLLQLEVLLLPKTQNLSPEERQQYGSVNETNKLFINKVRDYRQTEPNLSSPQVDWVEFEADFQDRVFLDTRLNRIASLAQSLKDAKILHDYDNYKNALVDYTYCKYMDGTGTPDYEIKYQECKQFFGGR